MPKWYCTDCEDTFTDEAGERCPSCGFRRIIGPVKYADRHEIKEALLGSDNQQIAVEGK